MASLQSSSLKIKKRSRADYSHGTNYVCGSCCRGYGCLSALNLHIKKKHNGETPPNTKVIKSERPRLENAKLSGRPLKSDREIDNLCQKAANLEKAEDEMAKLFGEKLFIINSFGPKPTVTTIVNQISSFSKDGKDKWFLDIQDESVKFLSEYTYKDSKIIHLDFSEEFDKIDIKIRLRVIVWIIIWLAQIYIHSKYVENLCFIFSKIWKVLEEINLNIQDLDNKLVWKKAAEECADSLDGLGLVKKHSGLLYIFIQNVCQLIGKAAEETDSSGL